MNEKRVIELALHYEKAYAMDELCDINDFDGIIKLCEELDTYTHSSALIRLHLYYNIGTGYSYVASRRDTFFASKTSGLALLNFRKALAEVKSFTREGFNNSLSENDMNEFYDLRNRLLTNLANELDYQGRRLEALSYYEEPIKSGNVNAIISKARCIYQLAQDVYDDSHAFYLNRESAKYYKTALSRINEFPLIQKQNIEANVFHKSFLNWFKEQEQHCGNEFPELNELEGRSPSSQKEENYFKWCVENKLFINELNGISTSNAVNQDVLSLPNFMARINKLLTVPEQLNFHGHFDEMKNDYCYARYLAFIGISTPLFSEHFFNSTFEHIDTLDYEINNLKTNHLKSCFRISYSIFDKISFFLHRFFNLDAVQNDHMVDFKKVWYKQGKSQLKDIFEKSDNAYFKALFFISHEIRQASKTLSSDKDLSYWFDPDTQRLFKIRNAIEHRSFKLVDSVCYYHKDNNLVDIEQHRKELSDTQMKLGELQKHQQENLGNKNDFTEQIERLRKHSINLKEDLDEKERMCSYSVIIGVEEFETLIMKLLALTKDALVYLSLAIHQEESKKHQKEFVIPRAVPKKNHSLRR